MFVVMNHGRVIGPFRTQREAEDYCDRVEKLTTWRPSVFRVFEVPG